MIIAYVPVVSGLERVVVSSGEPIPTTAVWIDLFQPSVEEKRAAARIIGVDIPAREDIASIETSERLYEAPGGIVMTALLPIAVRIPDPELSSVTFVLSSKRLVTLRYGEPKAIEMCSKKVQTNSDIPHTGCGVLFVLLDMIVDRCADVIESAATEYDAISVQVFEEGVIWRKSTSYMQAIRAQGRIGLSVARMHDVLSSLTRLSLFMSSHKQKIALSQDQVDACTAFTNDIHSIKEHADALDSKLSFLLDATVGLVNLEQNQIIKIVSVLAVIFLPPTLIASIYGMNFVQMPGLNWIYGYPFSVVLMVFSVAATFLYFRWKRLL